MRILLVCLIVLMTTNGCGSIASLAEKSLYPYEQINKEYPPIAKGAAPFEEIDLDGTYAYLNRDPESKVVLVYLHGNGEALSTDVASGMLELFAQLKLAFVVVDYPHYGWSKGEPNEESLRDAAKKAIAQAKLIANGRPIVLWGRSLGAAVALQAYSQDVDKLILTSAFTNFEEAAKAMSPLGRLVPKSFIEKNRYDSRAKMAGVVSPTLMMHGSKDDLIPYSMGLELSLIPKGDIVRFIRLEGAGHNDVFSRDELWQELNIFLAE